MSKEEPKDIKVYYKDGKILIQKPVYGGVFVYLQMTDVNNQYYYKLIYQNDKPLDYSDAPGLENMFRLLLGV